MTLTEYMLPAAAVAAICASKLGTGRQWNESLADMRKERGGNVANVAPLLPAAMARTEAGRIPVPMYRVADVLAYITSVRAELGCERPFPFSSQRFKFEVADPMNPNRYWRSQRAIPV